MQHTPFFPAWHARLAPMRARAAHAVARVRAHTLCQLEAALGQWLPADLFPKAPAHVNSRDRVYAQRRTFWCLLWQSLNPAASGREVVRQLQALFCQQGGPQISEEDGAYCRAKHRLPLSEFPKALAATARTADRLAARPGFLQGRPVQAVDGATVTLADTPKNRKASPPLHGAKGPSFPRLRLVVIFSMASGALALLAQGSCAVSELALLGALVRQLAPHTILMGDRGFGSYPVLALLQRTGLDFIGRTTRRVDGRRRHQRLGNNDWIMIWHKSAKRSPWLSLLDWAGLPGELKVRVVRGRCYVKGFRVRQVTLVTTLLDADAYPAAEILQAYLRRWRLERCLDDLKTTLQLEHLRGRSPAMVKKELDAHRIAYNLIRCMMAQAAAEHSVGLERLSFKGSVDGLRHFASAMAGARSQKKRQELWAEWLRTLAADLVPDRPGRCEPRAVKRKKNKYPRLNVARDQFRDPPKRNVRRKNARLRRLGLM